VKQARSILIVEDEEIIRSSLAQFLGEEGYETVAAGTVAAAVEISRQRDFHVAICDVQLPDGDGLALLRRLQQINPNVSGIIITAYGTVENAVEAFTHGAFDYLQKPVIFDDLSNKLERLFQFRDLYLENQALRRELARRDSGDELVGSSKSMKEVHEAIRRVALTNSNVLLVGESGTGKELFARTIHKLGPKKEERFLAMHCATRPVEALEAQLFGVASGTLSNGLGEHAGLFRQVGDGTLFLDEILQLPLSTQAKLLRAIEHRESLPLGGAEPVAVTCRLVAATTKELQQEVTEGRMLEDLFYRLDGVKIRIPPLRDRLDDVPELVDFFIAKHSRAMGQIVTGATSETIRLLVNAEWKGNVRQLDNAIARAVMMCDSTQLQPKDLPPDLSGLAPALPDNDDLRSAIRHYERLHIVRVLKQWPDKREAAKRLRLGLSSLYRKIEELGIDL
jgi:DNA-binding NtrC family response regulator